MTRSKRTWSKSPSGMLALAVLGMIAVSIAFEVLKAALTSPWFYIAIVVGLLVWIGREVWLRRRRRAAWARQRLSVAEAAESEREREAEAVAHQLWLDGYVEATDAMTGTEFEELVGRLLVRDGWTNVIRSGGAGDLGADVTAEKAGRSLVVQCKRYGPRNMVGSADMQRFVGTARPHHFADIALFVTTSRFTTAARNFGHSQEISLCDRDQLAQWMAGGQPDY